MALETAAIREKAKRFADELYPDQWRVGNDGAPKVEVEEDGKVVEKYIWQSDSGYVALEVREGDAADGNYLGTAYYKRDEALVN